MSKPITHEEMKAWIDATWEKCQSEAWREPRHRVGLTDEEIDAEFARECYVSVIFADGTQGIALDKVTARDFARAIERAHGIGGE